MKKQIRHGVFETNSSSTHSLVMCSDEQLEKWKKGELLYDGVLIPRDKYMSEEERLDNCLYTYDEFVESDYLEVGEDKYTTESGDVVHAIYIYGMNG